MEIYKKTNDLILESFDGLKTKLEVLKEDNKDTIKKLENGEAIETKEEKRVAFSYKHCLEMISAGEQIRKCNQEGTMFNFQGHITNPVFLRGEDELLHDMLCKLILDYRLNKKSTKNIHSFKDVRICHPPLGNVYSSTWKNSKEEEKEETSVLDLLDKADTFEGFLSSLGSDAVENAKLTEELDNASKEKEKEEEEEDQDQEREERYSDYFTEVKIGKALYDEYLKDSKEKEKEIQESVDFLTTFDENTTVGKQTKILQDVLQEKWLLMDLEKKKKKLEEALQYNTGDSPKVKDGNKYIDGRTGNNQPKFTFSLEIKKHPTTKKQMLCSRIDDLNNLPFHLTFQLPMSKIFKLLAQYSSSDDEDYEY